MLENAVRLCEAKFGNLFRATAMHFSSLRSITAPTATHGGRRQDPSSSPDRDTSLANRAATRQVAHIADVAGRHRCDPFGRAVELAGYRTVLAVPMLEETSSIGAIVICRAEGSPFDDKQIELLQTFAEQAVIAIENARLFNELQRRSRVAAAADRHRRRAQGHQPLDLRSADRARYAGRVGCAAVRGRHSRASVARRASTSGGELRRRNAFEAEHRRSSQEGVASRRPGDDRRPRRVLEGNTVHVADCQADPEYDLSEAQQVRRLPHDTGRSAPARRKPDRRDRLCRAPRCARSPTSRSSWSRPLPTRR